MIFLNSIRPEWKSIITTIKAHEQFKTYSLSKMVGILKSHVTEVLKEAKFVPSVGLLAYC